MTDSSSALTILFAVLGLACGSFINVLAYRVPERLSILGRSKCPGCRHTLGASELIPVVSFLFLRGHCRSCGMAIAWQYPIVEVLGALLFALPLRLHPVDMPAAISLALALQSLLLIAVTDARTQRIPDVFSLAFLFLSIAYAVLLPLWSPWGALLGGGFFALQWLLSGGRWVGSGDMILGLSIGILLGSLPLTIIALAVAYIAGAAMAAILLFMKLKRRNETIAFGPFLALGTVIAVFAGGRITDLILRGLFTLS